MNERWEQNIWRDLKREIFKREKNKKNIYNDKKEEQRVKYLKRERESQRVTNLENKSEQQERN